MQTEERQGWFTEPATALPGVGPKRAAALKLACGVDTLADLLRILPRRYREPARWVGTAAWPETGRVRLRGQVDKVWRFRPRGRRTVVGVRLTDADGQVDALFFHQPWVASRFEPGQELALEGEASTKRGKQLLAPRQIAPDEDDAAGLEAIYPDAGTLRSGQLAALVQAACARWDAARRVDREAADAWAADPLPEELRARCGVPALPEAWRSLHAPADWAELEQARRRLALGEVLALERARRRAQGSLTVPVGRAAEDAVWQRIEARLPFPWTEDQAQVIAVLRKDLRAGRRIRRLVHGEVGSGKTAIAFALALALAAEGRQAAVLAPTEILARQHLQTFTRWLAGSRLPVLRLLGDDSPADRRRALAALQEEGGALVVGTHALFSESVRFRDLGLVVLDEQHRFGVRQKAALIAKGEAPHVLTMTATPIPRTLAWAAYGALEPCVLRTRPGGGAPIRTTVASRETWPEVGQALARRARAGEPAFLVVPRIDGPGGLLELASRLQGGPWDQVSLGVVHGRLPGALIEAEVRAFAAGERQVLVGTTVVEVGLDLPDVPQMVVLGAERLGLASLHQLRGRLARGPGARPAQCTFLAEDAALDRLRILETCQDGFAVAEADLRLRGPGALRGLAQHGQDGFQVFDPVRDASLVERLRAEEIRNWLDGPG